MPVTEEFYPEGNSSTCVIEMRCEMLRKISKGCITTAYTYRFINMFICIFIGTSRSDSACLLFLTLFIVSGSLHLRQWELGTPDLGNHHIQVSKPPDC